MKMILSSIVILGVMAIASENADAQYFYLGARGGVNLANQSNNSLPADVTNDMNGGLLIGGEIDIPFDKTWYLCFQALYDQKGTNQNLDHAAITTEQSPELIIASGTSTIHFNYLEFPIYIKMMFGSDAIRPYAFAGPSFRIFLNGSESLAVTTESHGAMEAITSYQSIPSSSVKSPDISAIAGAGISLTFSSNTMLFADIAYALGLLNISPNDPIDNTVVKSRDLRLAAGILFPLD